MRDLLGELEAEERGIVLGALLGRGAEGLARIDGAAGERCAAAYRALQEAPAPQRQQIVRGLVERALAPLPEGLERVHPSWIGALLADEPEAVVSLIVAALPAELRARVGRLPQRGPAEAPDPRLRWVVCSRALGALAAMSGDGIPRAARAPLGEWSVERLDAAIVALGSHRAAQGAPAVDRATRRARGLRELAAGLPGALARAIAQRLPRELGLPLWRAAADAPSAGDGGAGALERLQRADRAAGGTR